MTPLHASCLLGAIEITETLLKQGADIHQQDRKKFTPVHYAVLKDHVNLVKFLFTQKYKLLDPVFYCHGHKLLSLAIQNGAYRMVKLLVLDFHENVMEKDANDYTYLHMAAISGHVDIFLFFLSKQVSLHSKNNKGKTAF